MLWVDDDGSLSVRMCVFGAPGDRIDSICQPSIASHTGFKRAGLSTCDPGQCVMHMSRKPPGAAGERWGREDTI